jgi:glycosyltransferase involved in cell wall biosynthesis
LTVRNKPTVSVIIPTYNRAALIGETIENVFQQTYRDMEVIVVDDGSTDNTSEQLALFGDRIRVISQSNAGASAARNRGVEAAEGEIIAFQDSDDSWMPSKLERQVALLNRAGSDVPCCLCSAEMHFTERGPCTSFDLAWLHPDADSGLWLNAAEVLATTSVLFNQCAAIRKGAFEKVGGFNEAYRYMEDYDLALRLSLEGDAWTFIKEPLVVWHQGSPQSLSLQANQIGIKQYEIRIRNAACERIKGAAKFENVRKNLKVELNRNRRELRIAQICASNVPGSHSLGWLLSRAERYNKAIHRRNSAYPKMRVRDFEKLAAREENTEVAASLRTK